ncbi:hypothetical protein B0H15DRAFT_843920 [Mycena belliarum]|uniref:Uncharacterized protein n=1 Tax=Mycena belliarum TaxID=1033014 RepID=A0AAD6U6S6_9AGAR|nr:hypothetical protein B0H15DRAFT_843920 [Mycena belliae]
MLAPRRPRRASPPSMYVPPDTTPAKPPKPLIKLDKGKKAKGAGEQAKPAPASAPRARLRLSGCAIKAPWRSPAHLPEKPPEPGAIINELIDITPERGSKAAALLGTAARIPNLPRDDHHPSTLYLSRTSTGASFHWADISFQWADDCSSATSEHEQRDHLDDAYICADDSAPDTPIEFLPTGVCNGSGARAQGECGRLGSGFGCGAPARSRSLSRPMRRHIQRASEGTESEEETQGNGSEESDTNGCPSPTSVDAHTGCRVVRAEPRWMGEWSEGDMRAVIDKLRALR